MLLSELGQGKKAVVVRLRGRISFRKRVMEMGLVPGKEVIAVRKTPFRGPMEFQVLNSSVVLRYSEAELVEVREGEAGNNQLSGYSGTFSESPLVSQQQAPENGIHVVMIGNPVSGKTALFNMLTGSHERVGNYCGVTVAPATRVITHNNYTIHLTDLPGIYSVASDEPVHRIIEEQLFRSQPDIILNVTDAGNLERNLFLTTDLIDMHMRTVMALNMSDELERSGDRFDHASFGHLTGMPVVPVSALQNKGRNELLDAIIDVYSESHPDIRHIHINYGHQIERSIKVIQEKIRIDENAHITDRFSSRFLSIRLLCRDRLATDLLKDAHGLGQIRIAAEEEIARLSKEYTASSEAVIADAKFGFIAGALKETYKHAVVPRRKVSEKIDAILLHRIFGFPVFVAIMWLMFAATFQLGEYPMAWIEAGVAWLSDFVSRIMAPGMLRDLLVDGIISGVGGVLVFLPNILILYFFIALMEDTGYMSRAVFIMDRLMHRIGLHGKSFIPLVMGFGCNVPAILSTRILENRNERMVTILMNPFMSCNARLPVYILFISAFFPNHSGTVLFGIYFLGVLMAILTALILRKTFFRKAPQAFVMELPPYRMPTRKALLHQMWLRSGQYLKKIGGVILIASILFWALSYFPLNPQLSKDYEGIRKNKLMAFRDSLPLMQKAGSGVTGESWRTLQQDLMVLETERKGEMKEKSWLGQVGRFIEPAIRPLGFDWRIGISILSGIPAKEIIISSLSILYHADEGEDEGHATLIGKLQSQHKDTDSGPRPLTPLVALSFMVFVLLYFPCIGTLSAISRESGSWKWGAFMLFYTLALAWVMSFFIYQGGLILGFE